MACPFTQNSITTIPEPDLVRRLMNDPRWREELINIHGIPDGVDYHLEVPLDGLPGNPKGDINVLLYRPGDPQDATAIQIKRIKVYHDAFTTGLPNKIGDFQKGVRQANLLAKLGFARIYLYVFIVVDSRSQNIDEFSFKGLSAELYSKINSEISPSSLDSRVGLIKFDFTQPMDYEPLTTGVYGGSIVRIAVSAEQPKKVTEWVAQVCSLRDT